jgi:hypothetical protein
MGVSNWFLLTQACQERMPAAPGFRLLKNVYCGRHARLDTRKPYGVRHPQSFN